MKTNRNILVIAAHGDDEVLGCGATMAKHAESGDAVHVLLLADGVSSRGNLEGLEQRNASADLAASVLGAHPPICLGLPDNRLDKLDLLDIVQKIEPVIAEVEPEILYIHHGGDLNVDHELAHRAALTAARPLPGSTIRMILGFEVLSSTGWNSRELDSGFYPTYFVDVEGQLEKKMKALRCYEQEMRDFPHARSYQAVQALATLRGAVMGMAAAESFTVIRQIA